MSISGLRIVDGLRLSGPYGGILRPGELLSARNGTQHRLPRWFYEVPSWDVAIETSLSPHFRAWEFMNVDMREHEWMRLRWPRYLPVGVGLLATALELLRANLKTYIHISVNGGYRSPSHRLSTNASLHCWGTAVNIYRIGDDNLDNERNITRYGQLARRLSPVLHARAYGHGHGETDDHLHLDVGYAVVTPEDATEEAEV